MEILTQDITETEIQNAISTQRNNNAVGADFVSSEIFKKYSIVYPNNKRNV